MDELTNTQFPRMARVKQRFARPTLTNIPGGVSSELTALALEDRIKPGDTVAVAATTVGAPVGTPSACAFAVCRFSVGASAKEPVSELAGAGSGRGSTGRCSHAEPSKAAASVTRMCAARITSRQQKQPALHSRRPSLCR